jgi:hypothetical protein
MTILCCFFLVQSNAQIRYGLRAGLSSSQLSQESIQANGVSLAIQDANYGYHFGVFGRVKLTQHWYLQPEAVINSNSVDFKVTDFQDGLMEKVLTEKFRSCLASSSGHFGLRQVLLGMCIWQASRNWKTLAAMNADLMISTLATRRVLASIFGD